MPCKLKNYPATGKKKEEKKHRDRTAAETFSQDK